MSNTTCVIRQADEPAGGGFGKAWRSDGFVTLTRAPGADAWRSSQASPKLLHGDRGAPPVAKP